MKQASPSPIWRVEHVSLLLGAWRWFRSLCSGQVDASWLVGTVQSSVLGTAQSPQRSGILLGTREEPTCSHVGTGLFVHQLTNHLQDRQIHEQLPYHMKKVKCFLIYLLVIK